VRILIAEDESMSRRLLEKSLTKWGYDVIVVSDGQQAWEVLQQANAPQLAIIDWMMPGLCGVELCQKVRQTAGMESVYLILLTARGEKEDIAAGLTAGANDYVTKPFDREELQARLRVGVRVLEMQTRMLADSVERRHAEDDRKQLEEQLIQSQKMESIGTLAGGVAHDFNNLLTVINGYTELLLTRQLQGEPLRQKLSQIKSAGERAAALTRQLLAFSRKQELERKTINLNDTIGDLMKMLRRIIGEDVDVGVHTAPNLASIFADSGQIDQVLMNLAVNARDAMPDGGKLTIETHNKQLDESYTRHHPQLRPGSYVRIAVSDTGVGMQPQTMRRIFDPFFSTKEVGEGTGLGLAMVYGIIKQHDGSIEVKSEVGRGTTFEIYLPAETRVAEPESLEVQCPLRGGTETILVAEDEESLRGLVQASLGDLGYFIIPVKDGVEAIEMFAANRQDIDLVMLDIVMPRLSGIDAFERIRAMDEHVPIFLVTGYCGEAVKDESVRGNRLTEEMGVTVIQKPYGLEALGHQIRAILDQAPHRDLFDDARPAKPVSEHPQQ
jgi:two-component system cell cycle sensor histidine kinase/response regulator CckA